MIDCSESFQKKKTFERQGYHAIISSLPKLQQIAAFKCRVRTLTLPELD